VAPAGCRLRLLIGIPIETRQFLCEDFKALSVLHYSLAPWWRLTAVGDEARRLVELVQGADDPLTREVN
jgi:hypothetical protein